MAASPPFKIYRADEYMGSLKYAEDAAAMVAVLGDGSTMRHGHRVADIVWTEGRETQPASESYDFVACLIEQRIQERKPKR